MLGWRTPLVVAASKPRLRTSGAMSTTIQLVGSLEVPTSAYSPIASRCEWGLGAGTNVSCHGFGGPEKAGSRVNRLDAAYPTTRLVRAACVPEVPVKKARRRIHQSRDAHRRSPAFLGITPGGSSGHAR